MKSRGAAEGRRPALDGLRGIAILAVLVDHYVALLPPGFAPALVRSVLGYGWVGVDLFFALSGFLITRILLRTKGAPGYLRSFWGHRALRIFPPYFLTLLVVFSVGDWVPALRPLLPPPGDRLLYVAFLGNLVALPHDWDINMLVHLWSLAIEEQFYAFWPFCVLLLSPRGLRALAVGIVAAVCALRAHYVAAFGASEVIEYLTITRADSLAIGALAAIFLQREPSAMRIRLAGIIAATGLVAFCIGVASAPEKLAFVEVLGYALLDVSFAALVFFAAAAPARAALVRALGVGPLITLGRYSYGMYLYHVPLLWSFRALIVPRIGFPLWNGNGFVVTLGLVSLAGATFLLAKLSFEYVEKPILGLKRYFDADTAKREKVASAMTL